MDAHDLRFDQRFDRNKTQWIEISEAFLKTIDPLFEESMVVLTYNNPDPCFISQRFINEFARFGHQNVFTVLNDNYLKTELTEFSLVLLHQDIKYTYLVRRINILYLNAPSVLFIFSKTSLFESGLSTYEKITHVSLALLKLNSTIDIGDDIGRTLSLVLAEAIKVFENGHFGAVFIVEKNYFKIISNIGYSSDIDDFRLPITDSFLYQSTQGKMDDLVMINDLRKDFKIYPIKSNTGEISMIKSSLVAPLFYKDSLFGTLGIDSNRLNAFDEHDLVVMRFIVDNIQTIISNQLTFLERSNQALTDHMTGLYNRYYFAESFNGILERAKRYDERFCLAMFDLDNLKAVNDTQGHLAGDLIIKALAKTLRKLVRRSDIVARFGGDEFIAVFLRCELEEIEQRLAQMTLEPAINDLNQVPIALDYSFSYGISAYPADGQTLSELINAADFRMYRQKANKDNKGH
jgi:diguanylate cyclase (GGDEF)-like protein